MVLFTPVTLMNERDRIQSLADCRGDSFEIARSEITDGKHPGWLVSRNPQREQIN